MASDYHHRRRRNLMLISTLIILYVITGTSVDDINNVRIYFLSVDISRPEVLIGFACLLFLWYWYQYWLAHRSRQGFLSDRRNILQNQLFLRRIAEKKIRKSENRALRIKVYKVQLARRDNKYWLEANKVTEEVGSGDWEAGVNRQIDLSAIRWRWLQLRNSLNVALARTTSFWDEVFPHVFALIALAVGLVNWFGPNCA